MKVNYLSHNGGRMKKGAATHIDPFIDEKGTPTEWEKDVDSLNKTT